MATANLTRQHHATIRAAEKLCRQTRAEFKRMEARLLKELAQVNKALDEIPKSNGQQTFLA